jgi:hypothetical protein
LYQQEDTSNSKGENEMEEEGCLAAILVFSMGVLVGVMLCVVTKTPINETGCTYLGTQFDVTTTLIDDQCFVQEENGRYISVNAYAKGE